MVKVGTLTLWNQQNIQKLTTSASAKGNGCSILPFKPCWSILTSKCYLGCKGTHSGCAKACLQAKCFKFKLVLFLKHLSCNEEQIKVLNIKTNKKAKTQIHMHSSPIINYEFTLEELKDAAHGGKRSSRPGVCRFMLLPQVWGNEGDLLSVI